MAIVLVIVLFTHMPLTLKYGALTKHAHPHQYGHIAPKNYKEVGGKNGKGGHKGVGCANTYKDGDIAGVVEI